MRGSRSVTWATVLGVLLVGCATQPSSDESNTADADLATVPTPTVTGLPLPSMWPNHGSPDCTNHTNSDPAIYPYKYDENTFILRENKCFNFEANFIYLLFGHDKVLMQDTGSIPQGFSQSRFRQMFPIRTTVESIISQWLAAHPNEDGSARTRDSIELLVTHSHSHDDHVSGDYQFKNGSKPYPHTQIAGLRPTEVARFFGIRDWPNTSATIDLGGRKLDILPIPGHEASHVAVYDYGSHLLLTGDTLYPGHLFIQDWAAYRASTARLNAWVRETDANGQLVRPIAWVLGNHIEKRPERGEASFYPYPSWIQNPERKLELTSSHVQQLANGAEQLGPEYPGREVFFDDFAIDASN